VSTLRRKSLHYFARYRQQYSIPGRGEYIRLALEAAKPSGVKYIDVANEEEGGYDKVQALMKDDVQPPNFAPPMLRVASGGKNGKDLVIHQSQ